MPGALKLIHVASVAASLALFALRLAWSYAAPWRLRRRWVRIVPHVIDTVLLASAIALVVVTRQYPLVHAWLTAKIAGVVVYIACGSLALTRARTRGTKMLASVGAIAAAGYVVAVALTRDPLPFP